MRRLLPARLSLLPSSTIQKRSGDREGVIPVIDDHQIPKPLEPVGIKDLPGKDGPNLGPEGSSDLDSVLSLFLEETDHFSLDRGNHLSSGDVNFWASVGEKAFLFSNLATKT